MKSRFKKSFLISFLISSLMLIITSCADDTEYDEFASLKYQAKKIENHASSSHREMTLMDIPLNHKLKIGICDVGTSDLCQNTEEHDFTNPKVRRMKSLGKMIVCRMSEVDRMVQAYEAGKSIRLSQMNEIATYLNKRLDDLRVLNFQNPDLDELKLSCYQEAKEAIENRFSSLLTTVKESVFDEDKQLISERLYTYIDMLSEVEVSLKENYSKEEALQEVSQQIQSFLRKLTNTERLIQVAENTEPETFLEEDFDAFSRVISDDYFNMIQVALIQEAEPMTFGILLANTLKVAFQRLDYFIQMKDLSCKLSNCQKDLSQLKQEELYRVLKIISLLATENNACDDFMLSSDDAIAQANIKSVSRYLCEKQNYVFEQLKSLKNMYVEESSEETMVDMFWQKLPIPISTELTPIYRAISKAQEYINHVERTGYYDNPAFLRVKHYPSQKKATYYLNQFSDDYYWMTNMKESVLSFSDAWEDFLEDLDVLDGMGTQRSALKEQGKQALSQSLDNLRDQMLLFDGIKKSKLEFSKNFKYRMQTIMKTQFKELYAQQVVIGNQETKHIRGRDAGKLLYGVQVDQGDFLELHVKGEWSPTCALNRSGYFDHTTENILPKASSNGYQLNAKDLTTSYIQGREYTAFNKEQLPYRSCYTESYFHAKKSIDEELLNLPTSSKKLLFAKYAIAEPLTGLPFEESSYNGSYLALNQDSTSSLSSSLASESFSFNGSLPFVNLKSQTDAFSEETASGWGSAEHQEIREAHVTRKTGAQEQNFYDNDASLQNKMRCHGYHPNHTTTHKRTYTHKHTTGPH